MSQSPDPPDHRSDPVGEGEHVVRAGEDLHSIAWRHGVDPTALWEHEGNAALRRQRSEGVLLPGDLLTIPTPAERASFPVSPGEQRRFKAQIPGHELQLALQEDGQPQANVRYTAEADGVRHEGSTDGGGHLTVPVRPWTRYVMLTLHEEVDGETYDQRMRVEVGGLNPADDLTGVQARLRNLGHSPGAADGELGPRTRRAIADFQRAEGLEATGELDDATRDRLSERHGH